jgi:hypothetical protein
MRSGVGVPRPWYAWALFLAVVVSGCVFDRTSAPTPQGAIEVVSGASQQGLPGAPLPEPLIVSVVDAAGVPVPNVRVSWKATDGGVIDPAIEFTGEEGRAGAHWTLGPGGGGRMATATVDGFPSVDFFATAPRTGPLPSDDIRVLGISTYDGSNETAHPDYAHVSADWSAETRDYLAITPYPNANIEFENPSVFASNDLVNWVPPPGTTNPVISPPPGAYLSDPDIVFDPDKSELLLYYREVKNDNSIYMMRSPNAGLWTDPVLVARARNHDIVSPSVVRRDSNHWMMWSVNTNIGCGAETTTLELRRSADGVNWTRPQRVSMSPGSLHPWHVDVQWIGELNEYWALFNAKPAFSCTTSELYLATSNDGVTWTTYPNPILSRGAIPEFADIVYRATFAYDRSNDAVTFWYSGARFDGSRFVWSSAVQQRNRIDVVREASDPVTRFTADLRVGVPQLTDPP